MLQPSQKTCLPVLEDCDIYNRPRSAESGLNHDCNIWGISALPTDTLVNSQSLSYVHPPQGRQKGALHKTAFKAQRRVARANIALLASITPCSKRNTNKNYRTNITWRLKVASIYPALYKSSNSIHAIITDFYREHNGQLCFYFFNILPY